jgi:hypothetical protein
MDQGRKAEGYSKPLSLIQFYLSNNVLQKVLLENSAASLWLKLELIYTLKDLTN